MTLSQAFLELGLHVDPDRIDLREGKEQGRHAVLSIPTGAVVTMLNGWVGRHGTLREVQPLLKQERNTEQESWPPRGVIRTP